MISTAPVLIGQFDDVVDQTIFVDSALRHLARRGSVLTQSLAGPALGHAKLPPHMIEAFATTLRAQGPARSGLI